MPKILADFSYDLQEALKYRYDKGAAPIEPHPSKRAHFFGKSMDPILAHDAVIADLLTRPIPTTCPDLVDVLLAYCAQHYGVAAARERAIDYLRQQQAKGLATYGVGLTVDSPIDPVVEAAQELADACCYGWVVKNKEPAATDSLATEDLEFDL